MGLYLFWQEHSTAIIVSVLTAIVVTLLKDMILAFLKTVYNHGKMLLANLNAHLLSRRFKHRYLKYLCEKQRFLNVRGIRSPSQVGVELEKVYISLKLRGPPRYGENIRSRADIISREKLSSTLQGEPDLFPATVNREAERLSIGDVLRCYSNRLVILGGPGTGKTTLLSYLALKFARGQAKEGLGLDEKRLPILIPLRELARRKTSLTSENLASLCVARELANESPKDFFKKRLQNGQCIVLLDGMDEVIAEEERYRVAEQIDDFVSTYPNNRFIVTSRPTGHSSTALAGFSKAVICDLSDDDVEAFAHHWCLAVEMVTRGVEGRASEAVACQEAERAAKELVSAIRANDRVHGLTVNPLLLTIVAMVHRYRATLPNRRVELYNECIEVLLGHWDEVKGIAGRFDRAQKRRVLEHLAYWMHVQGLRVAEKAQVEKIVAEALPTVGVGEADATEFLMNVQNRSGLLLEVGLGIYGFAHLTFQEYLTANYLVDQSEEGLKELLKYIHNPWWSEVILLYAGLRDATLLITKILAQREDLLKNNLFLAARCLVDVVNINPKTRDEVLSKVIVEFRAGEFKGLRNKARDTLIKLSHSSSGGKVIENLLGLLDYEDASVRSNAVIALGLIGKAEPRVIEALLKKLDDENIFVSSDAALALGRLGKAEPRVIEALLGKLGDEQEGMYYQVAHALGSLKEVEPRVVNALLEKLNNANELVRRGAALALSPVMNASGQVINVSPKVVNALLEKLTDESPSVRWDAIDSLTRIGQVGQLGNDKPRVITALLDKLNDGDKRTRIKATFAISQLGNAEPKVVDVFLKQLDDEVEIMRVGAIFALGQIGYREKSKMIEVLLLKLNDENDRIRMGVASVLGDIGIGEPKVIEALLKKLDDPSPFISTTVAAALRQLGVDEPRVTELLLSQLSNEIPSIRATAATALGHKRKAEARIVDSFLGLLDDEDPSVREKAAVALVSLGEIEPRIIDVLLQKLGDESEHVRHSVTQALFWLEAEPIATKALLEMLDDRSPSVRSSASIGLSRKMSLLEHNISRINPQISLGDLSFFKGLLKDTAEIEDLLSKLSNRFRTRKKDLAWEVLKQYSSLTGKLIYPGEEGEAN